MKIFTNNHYNKEVYKLENDKLIVKVLKDFGGKIVSIYHKDLDYEVLFQPTNKEYKEPTLGQPFENYDTSGIDEMLPTIDKCFYPNSYKELNDHGDLWAQKWDFEEKENSLVTKVRCDSIKLDLEREISLEGEKVNFSYKLYNPTVQDHFYLWAFHGLMNFDESTEIIFPTNGPIVNVIDAQEYDFDYRRLGDYPENSFYKFYFQDEITNGHIDIFHKNKAVKVAMDFDTNINKYLGLWLTKGGFKGEYNFALEPASGFYDSLDRAFKNNKFSKINSKESLNWSLTLEVTKGE